MLLFQCIVPFSFVVPGEVEMLLQRLVLHISIFGFGVFFYLLLPKMVEATIKRVLYAFLLLFVLEAIVLLFPPVVQNRFYIVSAIVLLSLLYGVCCVGDNGGWGHRAGLNLDRLRRSVVAGAFPLVVGMWILLIYHLSGRNHYAGWAAVVFVSFIPLCYVCLFRPACWNYDELAEMKKKAYLLGKNINKDGQFLEDDGGIINEIIVDDARILYNIMKLFEEEKIYRNYEIKIGEVAKRIGTNKTYLSRVLNTRVSKNFCQFVNYYRIKEICTMFLKDPKQEIRYLSEYSGFSSQSNFSIVFKYNTGYTPGDWCRLVKSKLEKNEAVDVDDYLL